ncbi:MAG TPA: DUF3105 domain-containing protein [Actinomycetota bacterium]|nr:DUF3105 domain-containing protein [Actinomycetota bacterium]
MAKKKKRVRPRPGPTAPTPADGDAARRPAARPGVARGGANIERRERKDEARRLREAERRRARRAASLRRTVTSIGIAAAAVAAIILFRSFGGPNDIPQAAIRAAEEAGCTEVDQPASSAPSGQHLQPGQDPGYTDTPATSGFHDPAPLADEPKVYDSQPNETNAVHSLEHGAVFVYYLPAADGGLSQELIDRLAPIAEGSDATFLAPYPSLTAETALTLTAWNRRQSCPAGDTLTPQAASTIVNGFVTGFECTGNAPESSSPC